MKRLHLAAVSLLPLVFPIDSLATNPGYCQVASPYTMRESDYIEQLQRCREVDFDRVKEENRRKSFDYVAVSPIVGSQGLGAEGLFRLSPQFMLRIGPSYLKYSRDEELDDVNYDLDLSYLSGSVIGNWHPFENGWHLSAGLSYGDFEVDLDGTPNNSVTIGNNSYSPSEIGTINGKLENSSLSPYVGLGYDNTFTNDSDWSFRANVGVLYTGSPKASLSSNGSLASNASFQQDLAREESNLEEDVEIFQIYPVLNVGFSYQF